MKKLESQKTHIEIFTLMDVRKNLSELLCVLKAWIQRPSVEKAQTGVKTVSKTELVTIEKKYGLSSVEETQTDRMRF